MNDPALAACDQFIAESGVDKTAPDWRTKLSRPPSFEFEPSRSYHWDLQTNHGEIRIKLMPEVAPMHCGSTLYLTRLGFFDGLGFHRVIPGFMAQGGCPLGTGTGGPGYQYDGECDRSIKHDRAGLLSMANAGPGTDGSQFFLTLAATPWLDGKHTIFGEVVGGLETLDALEQRGTQGGRTTEPLQIHKATVDIQ